MVKRNSQPGPRSTKDFSRQEREQWRRFLQRTRRGTTGAHFDDPRHARYWGRPEAQEHRAWRAIHAGDPRHTGTQTNPLPVKHGGGQLVPTDSKHLEEAARQAEARGDYELAMQLRQLAEKPAVPSARALQELVRGHRPSGGPYIGTNLSAVESAYIGEKDDGITLNFYVEPDGWYWDAVGVFLPTASAELIQEKVGPYKSMQDAFEDAVPWVSEQLDANLPEGWRDRMRWRTL